MSRHAQVAHAASEVARVIATNPTAAAPSFNGRGWLVVINLTVFTAGTYLMAMLLGWLVGQVWKYRHVDQWSEPVSIYRRIGVCWSLGFMLRCGAEAFSLWAWDPASPGATATAMEAKRFVDPIAFAVGMAGMAQFALALRGMVPQLRKRPFPIDMWANRAMLKRPLIVVALCLIAAIGVVSLR